MFCYNCGKQLQDSAFYCDECGFNQCVNTQAYNNSHYESGRNGSYANIKRRVSINFSILDMLRIAWTILRIAVVVIIAVGVIRVIRDGTLLNALNTVSYANEIVIVQTGVLNGYPHKMVGEAFNDFMTNAKWEAGKSEDGDVCVNVRGEILYYDKRVEAVVQFIVDYDKGTFQYHALEFNGVPQSYIVFLALLEKIYE